MKRLRPAGKIVLDRVEEDQSFASDSPVTVEAEFTPPPPPPPEKREYVDYPADLWPLLIPGSEVKMTVEGIVIGYEGKHSTNLHPALIVRTSAGVIKVWPEQQGVRFQKKETIVSK